MKYLKEKQRQNQSDIFRFHYISNNIDFVLYVNKLEVNLYKKAKNWPCLANS